ncbi:MAG: lytic transglycosylase domain-containing protein [Candidatus Rariloculaceae bacterium]
MTGIARYIGLISLSIAGNAALAQAPEFSVWLEELRLEAIGKGISEATVNAALADVAPVERIIELDRNQPEFKLDFWGYVDRVVSDTRITQGQAHLETHGDLLEDVQSRYGIPPHVLVAAWGIESNYGRTQGSSSVVSSLVTLAYDERRAAFFRAELMHALRILDEGHIEFDDMRGSWAGAMGQLQFMPSTFIDYARDGDGDGRKDIWNNPADAVESAANFMSSAGWQRGIIWGRQIQVPENFDTELEGLDTRKQLSEWQTIGVRTIEGDDLPAAAVQGSVVLPADGLEPAFMVYQNYRTIMRWNRSHLFAISVGHLADRIAGKPPLQRTTGAMPD